MSSAHSVPHSHNEEAAYAYVEARIWPDGLVCPDCGSVERISKMQGRAPASALTSATSAASPSP